MKSIKHNESRTGEECYYNPQVDYFPLLACLSVLFPLKQQFANKFIYLFIKYCTFYALLAEVERVLKSSTPVQVLSHNYIFA